MNDVVNDRGLFWWADTPVPETHFAPDDAVAGTLTVGEDGAIALEFDGVLPSPRGAMAAMHDVNPDRAVAGLLKSDGRYILASELSNNGGRWSTSGISFQRFTAMSCLASATKIPQKPKVRAVDFDLEGYEEWLQSGHIEHEKSARRQTFTHRRKPDAVFPGDIGSLRLRHRFSVEQSGSFGARGTHLRERARLRLRLKKSVSPAEAQQLHNIIGELMVLLTGVEHRVPWAEFILTKGEHCTAFGYRNLSSADPVQWHRCISNLPSIAANFGEIFFNWIRKRAEYGPGAYLYAATKRGLHLYNEHRFANFMWGLEALHRKLTDNALEPGFELRRQQILEDVENPKNRKWLKGKMAYLGQPTLQSRIIDLFKDLPSGIDLSRLKVFAGECASVRNHLSHTGQPDEARASDNASQFVYVRTESVGYLYHAKLLLEIGMPHELVQNWLISGNDRYRMDWFFVRAGLRDEKQSPPRVGAEDTTT